MKRENTHISPKSHFYTTITTHSDSCIKDTPKSPVKLFLSCQMSVKQMYEWEKIIIQGATNCPFVKAINEVKTRDFSTTKIILYNKITITAW